MPRKKEQKLDAKFYIEEVGVNNWLKCNEPQIIRFINRFEYKENNVYHKEDGPAIEFFDGVGHQYYVKGRRYENEEYTNYRRTKLIDKMNERNK